MTAIPSPEALRFALMVSDLDRCPHGRHEGDACAGWTGPDRFDGGCHGGVSLGNPFIPSGTLVGYDISGRRYVMPVRGKRHDPAAWRSTPNAQGDPAAAS